jgi:hypothetical protein
VVNYAWVVLIIDLSTILKQKVPSLFVSMFYCQIKGTYSWIRGAGYIINISSRLDQELNHLHVARVNSYAKCGHPVVPLEIQGEVHGDQLLDDLPILPLHGNVQRIAADLIFGKPLAAQLREEPHHPELVVVGRDPEGVNPVDVLLVDVHEQVGQPKHKGDDLLTKITSVIRFFHLPTEEGGHEEGEHPVVIDGESEVQAVHVVDLLGCSNREGKRGLS